MPETIAAPVSAPAPAAPAASSPAPAPSSPTPAAPATPTVPTGPLGGSEPSIEDKLTTAITSAREAVQKELGGEPEAKPAEVPPAETKPETTEPAAETKPAETTEEKPAETEDLVIEEGNDLTPVLFAQELRKHPEAQKMFDENPGLKSKIFGALRRDTENRAIRAIVPTEAAAKEMQRGAVLYTDFDNTFLDSEEPANAPKFVERLIQEAVMVDDKGQYLKNPDGSYQLHPALPNILNHIHRAQADYHVSQFLKTGQMSTDLQKTVTAVADAMASQAKLSGDERMQEAAAIFKEALSPSSPASEELPEHLKAREASLQAKEAEMNKSQEAARQRQSEESKAANQKSIDTADQRAAQSLMSQLKTAIARSGMTPAEAELYHSKVGTAIDEKLSQNPWFKNLEKAILREPPSEAREKKHTALLLEYAQEYLPDIATAKMREVLGGALKRQTERQEKIDTQTKVSATEPRGTSITMGAPQGKVTNAQVVSEYKASHNGEEPSMEYVMAEVMKRQSAHPAA